jgi:ribosomal-protein-alanine N-acetyltransferase
MLAASDEGALTLTTNADIPETIAWYKRHFGYVEVGREKKKHEFGRADVHEWTTLRTDLADWRRRRDASR